jgi:hypothetical protein
MTFKQIETFGGKAFEATDYPCPFCASPLYIELATPYGKVNTVCGNRECTAKATSDSIENCLLILEQVKEQVLIERGNIEYQNEFPKGDNRPE